jgi:Na+/H+-dicarboxylate symporter
MFSLGLGLVVTFNINGVKNQKFIKQLRDNIDKVRNSFLKYFFITAICYVLDYYFRQKVLNITTIEIKNFHFELNWSVLFCVLMSYSIVYYIINFIEIQKLNNSIFDKTNEQSN